MTGAIALPIVVPRPVVKTTTVAPAADQTRRRFLIVTRSLHQIEAAAVGRLGIFNHAFDARRSGLGNCAQ